jgi:hypothetical protein
MTEHAPDRVWSGIDIPKTIAGVLAAVSAAVVGSFLGVAGTLVGAAVASLIGSVGTEIYHRLFDKSRKTIQTTFLAPAAVGTPPVEAAADEKPSAPPTPRKLRWGRVAMVAGALFVLAMGTLTVAEAFAGRSIADATRGGSGDSTTLSSLFTDKSGNSEKPAPAPSESSSPTSPDQTSQPTSPATSTSPTSPAAPTATTTAPAGDTPTTDAPTTDNGTGTGTGTGDGTGNADTGSGGGASNDQKSGVQGADPQNRNDGTE